MQAPKSLRRPSNWQDFEKLCKKLWGEVWNCPEIKKNGRAGQNQNGVDVYGIPAGESQYYGIQCKGKDEYTNKQFTEAEILQELEKAKAFNPPLKKLYLATTAVKDVSVEEFVRAKNVEHLKFGLFEVHLYCWEDIVDLIDENRNTHDWYVNSQNYRAKAAAKLTFEDGSEHITAKVMFLRKIRHYVHSPQGVETEKKLAQFFKSRAFVNSRYPGHNESYFKFFLRLHNTGTEPIEEFKITFQIEGDIQNIQVSRPGEAYSIVVNTSDNVFFNDDERSGTIVPIRKILVGDDTIAFNDLIIKPVIEPSTVKINWQLKSKHFRTSGTLIMDFQPEIIEERVVISIADKNGERVEPGEIEDHITNPVNLPL